VIATSDVRPTAAALAAVLPQFTGAIEQVPPAYSALKVDGERAYDLARDGEEVVLARRAVTVFSLSSAPSNSSPARGGGPAKLVEGLGASGTGLALQAPPPPAEEAGGPPPRSGEELVGEATLTAHVSKGTYIRSLARDIALALGTVGHVTMLRRVKAGPFTLENAISLDKLHEAAMARDLEHLLLPLRAGLDDIPALPLTPDQAGLLRQGRVLSGIASDDGLCFAMLDDVPVALAEVQDGNVSVIRGFNL
jgi:tRNA pseudouridine55 synthase